MKFLIFSQNLPILVLAFMLGLCSTTYIDFSHYHKTKQIDQIMSSLVKTCKRLNIQEYSADKIFPHLNEQAKQKYSLLKYYDIKSSSDIEDGNSSTEKTEIKKQNVFLLAGEHPRELIAVELLLNFIITLCNSDRTDNSASSINSIIKNFNFRVIINANPNGRDLVEQGEYCKRSNLNNVDINRNWDIFWSKDVSSSAEENPGAKPFSELETEFVKRAVENFNAKLFLTIHSGVYGLYLPYAYLEKEGN
jgi:hypothetical protein